MAGRYKERIKSEKWRQEANNVEEWASVVKEPKALRRLYRQRVSKYER
jgi:hypothetical protein